MRRLAILVAAAAALPGCTEDPCLVFDYAPASAFFTLTDTSTGDPICDVPATAADERTIIAHPERCEYEMPRWFDPELGQTVVLQAPGFGDETVSFPSPVEDECGEIAPPEPRSFELSPAPD